MKLYYTPGACSLASHIALEESGIEFDSERVDLFAGEQRTSEFLRLNPKGRIPVLVTPQGVITENIAILMFAAMANPTSRLAPLDNPFALAKMQSFNAYLATTVHVAHAHGPRGSRWADRPESLADMKSKVSANMAAAFQLIEDEYFVGPWVLGDDYTVADAYLFTFTCWLESDEVNPTQFDRVWQHHQSMLERPAVQAVLNRERAAGS